MRARNAIKMIRDHASKPQQLIEGQGAECASKVWILGQAAMASIRKAAVIGFDSALSFR